MLDLRRGVGKSPLLVGHRGAMAEAPENTMPSFAAGLAAGADILELDAQLSADGQVVVFHDYQLDTLAGVPGRTIDHPAAYLQTLDVGRHFHERFTGVTIPLLEEVLVWAKGRISLMIELKHGPLLNPALDSAVVRLVEKHGLVDDVACISFDQFALRRIKALNPEIATSFIFTGRVFDPVSLVKGLTVDALSPTTHLLTQEEVIAIQAAGYACTPGGWYWNYGEMIAWGVDSVSSNDPAQVRKMIPAGS